MDINPQMVIHNMYYYTPSTFNLEQEYQYIVLNCIPDTHMEPPSYYIFTSANYLCYCCHLEFQGNRFVIILLSKCILPKLIFTFLRDMKKFIDTQENIENAIQKVWETISLIKYDEFNPGPVTYKLTTGEEYEFEEIEASEFSDYDAFFTFPATTKIPTAWKTLLVGDPIKVLAKNEIELTRAVFAIMRIIQPYKFVGNILVCLNQHDPRLLHATDYPIVGALWQFSKSAKGNFKLTMPAGRVLPDSNVYMERALREKAEKMKEIHLYLLDREIFLNPYNDILEGAFIKPSLATEFKSYQRQGLLSPQELERFSKTHTAIRFREINTLREAFRNAILSVPAEEFIPKLTIDEATRILAFINEKRSTFEKDYHLYSVLKKHVKLLKKNIAAAIAAVDAPNEASTDTPSGEPAEAQ